MTNITGIDTLFQAQQNDTQQQPKQNFAHELAKSNEQDKPGSQDPASAKWGNQADAQEFATGAKSLSATEIDVQYTHITDPAQARQFEDAMVMPTGITEALLGARLFGWHAQAQAYLSELTVADKDSGNPDAAEKPSASIEEAPAPFSDSENEPPASAAAQDAAEDVAAASDAGAVVQDQQRVVSNDAAPASALEPATADAQASGYWAERSLRLVRQRDGGVVAWLRDFRVADDDRPALLKAVLHEAGAQGVALNKIMLNGREVWSSPNSH
jgi:hypothetical protein